MERYQNLEGQTLSVMGAVRNDDWVDEVYSKEKPMQSVDRLVDERFHNKYVTAASKAMGSTTAVVPGGAKPVLVTSLPSKKPATGAFKEQLVSAHHQWLQKSKNTTIDLGEEKKEDDITTTMVGSSKPKSTNSRLFELYGSVEVLDVGEDGNELTYQEQKRDLRKICHMLDMERVKTKALQNKLAELASTFKAVKESNMGDNLEEYVEIIRNQKEEMAQIRENFRREYLRRKELERQLALADQENERCHDHMHTLMFGHLPTYSPKFKEIGPVDSSVKEDFDQVGPYFIGPEIGEGHFGSVLRACHRKSRNEFAMKVLQKDRLERYKDVQQVASEVHVLKNYSHPNIIKLEEVIHAPHNIYLVMELMGMDLQYYLNVIGVSEENAMQVLYGILQPLVHLHSNGICHLDLKPENVLLPQSLDVSSGRLVHQHVRLCDFGFARMASKPGTSKEVICSNACGTPGFWAPEMSGGSTFEGRRADMWSLGCVLMEITLGFTRHWTRSYEIASKDMAGFQEGIETVLEELFKEGGDFSEHDKLISMLGGLLVMDPKKRMSAEEALDHPWLDDVLLSANRVELKMAMGMEVSPSQEDLKDVYKERKHLVGPPPGFGPL